MPTTEKASSPRSRNKIATSHNSHQSSTPSKKRKRRQRIPTSSNTVSCPECDDVECGSKVVRTTTYNRKKVRDRKCLSCGHNYITTEHFPERNANKNSSPATA